MSAVQGASAYSQGQSNASSIMNGAKMNALQNQFQAEMLEERRKDIMTQSEEDVAQRNQQLRSMLGDQKVAFAAQGIEVEGELGEALAGDAERIAMEDVRAIKNNAWKESMGIDMDQESLRFNTMASNMQAKAQAQDSRNKGLMGVISSGVSAYGLHQRYGSSGKKVPSSNK